MRSMSTSGANLTQEGKRLNGERSAREASDVAIRPAKRSAAQVLKSYFYWTYSRGSFNYDVMVTLILAFIFITPLVWDFGDQPAVPPRIPEISSFGATAATGSS